MEGMLFDAGTWWLVTIIVTVVVGLIGYLFGRSVFKALDENRADIKEVRESYTTQKDHKDDLDDIRREIKEVRSEMKTEIQALSEDIKEVKEKCLRKSDFVPFPVSWTVKMKKKQKETQDILSYHSQAAGCSDKTRAKASGGRQPIEECGRTGL